MKDNADYAVGWMKDTQLFMSMSNTIWPSVWIAILPVGGILYKAGILSAPVFLTVMILSLGIVGPILAAIKFTDSVAQLGTIIGAVCSLLSAPEMKRPSIQTDIQDLTIKFQDVSFSYDENVEEPVLSHVNLIFRPNTYDCDCGTVRFRKIHHYETYYWFLGSDIRQNHVGWQGHSANAAFTTHIVCILCFTG